MTYDKVVDSTQLDGALTATASAIREKGGTVDVIPWNMETGFASAVSAMEAGGAELNFSVTDYASEDARPATADENTIAVITGTPIAGYQFSEEEPVNPVEGNLWIYTGDGSNVAFNALKENTVIVYPLNAKQYVSGSWITVDAYSYQGGEWVKWWQGELYDYGNQFEHVTGGWTIGGTFNADGSITVSASGGNATKAITENKVNRENYSTFNVQLLSGTIYYALSTVYDSLTSSVVLVSGNSSKVGTVSVDISNVSVPFYVVVYAYQSTAKFGKVWFS